MFSFNDIEQQIAARMATARTPGLAIAVAQGKEVIYANGFGTTSMEDGGIAVTAQTLFRIGSTTKPLTGTLIMRLVEEGKLTLDQPIKQYIPWFTLRDAAAAEQITLRMLLTHTAGLPDDYNDFGWRDSNGLEAHVRAQITAATLIVPPGQQFAYSEMGINLAGYLAEVVTGKTYTALMAELVFDPLQMSRTTFDPTVAMTYPLAQSHQLAADGSLVVEHRFADNSGEYPSGFAYSTVLDMTNFAIMQMNEGQFKGGQILSPASVAAMQSGQVVVSESSKYGLTFYAESYKGIPFIAHGGDIGSFRSTFVVFPAAQVALTLIYNYKLPEVESPYTPINRQIYDYLLGL